MDPPRPKWTMMLCSVRMILLDGLGPCWSSTPFGSIVATPYLKEVITFERISVFSLVIFALRGFVSEMIGLLDPCWGTQFNKTITKLESWKFAPSFGLGKRDLLEKGSFQKS